MTFEWLLGCVNRPRGLFAYLISRHATRVKLQTEKARQEGTADLIRLLPNGAVFKDGTGDSWREIWMPPTAPRPALFILPPEQDQPQAQGPSESNQARQENNPSHSLDKGPTQLTAGEHSDSAD